MNFNMIDDENDDFEFRAPPDGGNIRIRIDRYSVSEEVVNYFVTIFDMSLKKDWTFKSR